MKASEVRDVSRDLRKRKHDELAVETGRVLWEGVRHLGEDREVPQNVANAVEKVCHRYGIRRS